MKQQKVSFYFVLYIVAVCSGFVAVRDRDDAEERLKKDYKEVVDSLVMVFTRPINLYVPKVTRWPVSGGFGGTGLVLFAPSGLLSEEEKRGVKYYVTTTLDGRDVDSTSTTIDATYGVGLLRKDVRLGQSLTFWVMCKVPRKSPSFFPDSLRIAVNSALKAGNEGHQVWSGSEKMEFKLVGVPVGVDP